MPIVSTNPTIKDGETYPYLGINLAISPAWKGNDVGGSVAMRLTPYRIDNNGEIQKLDDDAKAVVYLDVFIDMQNDPQLANVVTGIMGAIQQFIIDKGL